MVIKYNGFIILIKFEDTELNEVLFSLCKDLIEDANLQCDKLVFKDICLEILAKSRLVLNNEQFEELVTFVTEILRCNAESNSGRRIKIL